jgi:predicted CDP-diglyceride synthetase/phosphatidate cytidylyltransferase
MVTVIISFFVISYIVAVIVGLRDLWGEKDWFVYFAIFCPILNLYILTFHYCLRGDDD